MQLKLGVKIAALAGGLALTASPIMAAVPQGGGGHFGGAARAGSFSGRSGTWTGGHSGTWSGGHTGAWGGWRGRGGYYGGYWGPGWGWWGDPFLWGGIGLGIGYGLAPYDYGYYYDDYGAPYDYPPPAGYAPPSGYDCDGWRWEPSLGRYVPAKVACE